MSPTIRRLLTMISAVAIAVTIPAQTLAYTVTSHLDDGTDGTLRYGIDSTTDDTIDFDPAGNGTDYAVTGGQYSIGRNLTINGNGVGQTTLNAQEQNRIFKVQSEVTFTVSNLTMTGGSTGGNGGAVKNSGTTNLDHVTITGNSATNGGGIYSTGTLNVTDSTITGNQASGEGGGISAVGSAATITRSTIDHNTAGACGGGIYYGDSQESQLTVTNSTISTNSSSLCGGGVALSSSDQAQFTNVTIAYNTVDFEINNNDIEDLFALLFGTVGGAGVAVESSCSIICIFDVPLSEEVIDNNAMFVNSIVAMNTTTITTISVVEEEELITTEVETDDCNTLVISMGDNLDTDGDCFNDATDLHGDPQLGPLQDNGGPTQTHAITNTSLAYNNDPCLVETDQRGVGRPQFGFCDIGAFELADFTPGGGITPTGAQADAARAFGAAGELPDAGVPAGVALLTFLAASTGYYFRRLYALAK